MFYPFALKYTSSEGPGMPSLNVAPSDPSEFHLLHPGCPSLPTPSSVSHPSSLWRAVSRPFLRPRGEAQPWASPSSELRARGEAYAGFGDDFRTLGQGTLGSQVPKGGLEGEVWALGRHTPWALWLIVLCGECAWGGPESYPLKDKAEDSKPSCLGVSADFFVGVGGVQEEKREISSEPQMRFVRLILSAI